MYIQYGTPCLKLQNLEGPETIDEWISLKEEPVRELEQIRFVSEQDIMWVYKIEVVKKKLKWMKQLTLQDMFKMIKDCSAGKNDYSGSHCSTSGTF
jgi:hypothetical protein